jgi:class 3 adenylate cyclase
MIRHVGAGSEPPETRYTRIGDADVAYQVVGDGPVDLVYCRGAQHLEVMWEHPALADFLGRLASFSRLILFDRRGWGASDPVPRGEVATWEAWADDIGAVLDAVGSEQTAIFGEADAGAISVLFTAMHPDRVSALILGNASARLMVADDYPIGYSPELGGSMVALVEQAWGSVEMAKAVFPSRADDLGFLRFAARALRAAATPRSAAEQYRYMIETQDVREFLPLIHVPTLVLHNRGNPLTPVEHARYLAAHIDDARLVEIASDDGVFGIASDDPVPDEVAEFLTGERPIHDVDRVLTTVLFTDIVGSTAEAARVGDQRWRGLLDAHDRSVREQLARFRGREVNTTGDGFVASFDGPARAIRCARAITREIDTLGLQVRAGLHTGECELRGDDLAGIAVHVAARIGAHAGPGEVIASSTVKDLVAGSGIEFADRGEHELRGVPGSWRLYSVVT